MIIGKNKNKKQISLAYDSVYKIRPVFWSEFIKNCKDNDHDIRFVSLRTEQDLDNGDLQSDSKTSDIPYILTNGSPKSKFLNLVDDGFYPDIWIEGNPECVLKSQDTCNRNIYNKFKFVEQINIALDFDDTYNAAPKLFDGMLDRCHYYGYDTRIVTARCGNIFSGSNADIHEVVYKKHSKKFKAFFTQLQAKKTYLLNNKKTNFYPHVWIDDRPEFIFRNHFNYRQ